MVQHFQKVSRIGETDATQGQGRTALSATSRWATNSLEGWKKRHNNTMS